jgi:hypothetical protein
MSDDIWSAGTWQGARDELLRRSLRLTPRERLELLEELARTSEHLLRIGEQAREASERRRLDAGRSP